MSDQVGKIEQLTRPFDLDQQWLDLCADILNDKDETTEKQLALKLVQALKDQMTQNTRIRNLENEIVELRKQHGALLTDLDKLATENRVLREKLRGVFARIRERGYVVVPAPMLGSTGFATLVLTAIPDQDAIEREVMG